MLPELFSMSARAACFLRFNISLCVLLQRHRYPIIGKSTNFLLSFTLYFTLDYILTYIIYLI